ncbi:MAG: hypothetical protein LBR76_08300 [Oscillospiraceae bacterium]|nr:hypothetical protein [Oscillospiraceae bacterium]
MRYTCSVRIGAARFAEIPRACKPGWRLLECHCDSAGNIQPERGFLE